MARRGDHRGFSPSFTGRLLACWATAFCAFTLAPAVTLQHLNLSRMVARAGAIFRGTVVGAERGTVLVGGVWLPTTDYTIRIDEPFAGSFALEKGQRIHRMRTIAAMAPVMAGGALHMPLIPEMPRLEKGKSYLLFTTAPGPAGLSTTVGLDQGCFRITIEGSEERVLNGFGNLGLFSGMTADLASGEPVEYGAISAMIRSELNGR